jgi:TolB-like protein
LKNPLRKLIRITTPFLTGLLLFCIATPALAAPARVAILPFEINAEKDMTFLQEGILDMLGSRLAWHEKVEVINENETKAALASVDGFDGESRALLVGGKLQADYVLFGSLTVFGESVSIDAKMVDVSGQQAPLPFFAQTRGMGEVIPQINQFASNINATVFGRGVAQRPAVAAVPQSGTAAATGAQPAPPAYDPRMHPEKLLQSGIQAEKQVPVAGQPYQTPNPAFVAAAGAAAAAGGGRPYWKSRNFKTLISGIGVADVDNDGRNEVVFATDDMVAIYHMENGRLVKKAEVNQTRTSSNISVDIGDINGNGTPEIYVTSLSSARSVVDSFILEYNGTDYQTISKGNNWYYRVVQTPDRGTILLGQRQRAAESSIFYGAIHEMRWQGDDVVPGVQLLKGGKTNLMGVAYGDVTHTGRSNIVAYSMEDRLRIYGSGDDNVYEDDERTGGNMAFFNLPKVEPGQPNKQHYPLRIRTTDIDRDGKTEILVGLHKDLARNMLRDFRDFKNGQIECKEWNGLTLASKWQTQEFKGRVSDFIIGDYDNDGMDELVVAVVAKEGSIAFMDALSSIMAFDLDVQ